MKEVVEVSSYGGYKLEVGSDSIKVIAPGGETITVNTMGQARRWIKAQRRANR